MKAASFSMSCRHLQDAFFVSRPDFHRPPSIVAPAGDRPFSAISMQGAGGI
jgi:hypothetical protein